MTDSQEETNQRVWADRLVERLRDLGRVGIAFSGGVDSSVVAAAAVRAVGPDAVALTGQGPALAASELESARAIARTIGIRHVIVPTTEIDDEAYTRNDASRCYHCKTHLYQAFWDRQSSLGFGALCSGANADDAGDYRPGLTAAAEQRVEHPLLDLGLGKEAVRSLARFWNVPSAEKPASPCLASRLALGVEVTPERVGRVERAEAFIRELGLHELRVRYHDGDLARIEVGAAEIGRLLAPAVREAVVKELRSLGFRFVSLDLEGFRSGSLNALIPAEELQRAARHLGDGSSSGVRTSPSN
ncbi:ATP-dependent sacrificial sulfur transferase LarE [Planctomycetes bacterium Pan216]